MQVWSKFEYLVPNFLVDNSEDGDNRVWFFVPAGLENEKYVYCAFPFGGEEEEVQFIDLDPSSFF